MNSCAGSCCTCFLKISYAFGTSASSPTGGAPLSCHFAFACSAQRKNRKPNQTSHPAVTHMTFGAAPSVVDRWWLSKGSPLPNSDFVLHHWSPLRHETTLASSNPSRALVCSVPLRLASEQISSSHLLSRCLRILSLYSAPGVFCRALPHSLGDLLHRCLPPFNLHRARVRRNHGRLRSNGLIERAQSTMPCSTPSPKRASD
jgi:hypothetical protein